MGVTIFYQGKLKTTVDRDVVIDIIQDIAQSLDWGKDFFYDQEKDLKGVILNPYPDCDTFNFIFDKEGLLVNSLMYGWKIEHKVEPLIDSTVKLCFCKTQFSNPNTHIAIIRFLIFLKKNYFKHLKIEDEGGYYPNGNTEELFKKIDIINKGIEGFNSALNQSKIQKSQSNVLDDQNLVDKIEEIIQKAIVKWRNKSNNDT